MIHSQGGATTAVLGLGNVLMGDDALGPHVIARLQAGFQFPPEVSVRDLGTPGLDLHPHVAGARALIIVDTVRSVGEAGELRFYRRDQILAHSPVARVSPHDPGLKEALLCLEFAGGAPEEIYLVGVIPDCVGSNVGLSDAVARSVEDAVAAVLSELHRLGHEVLRRTDPAVVDLWWEKSPAAPEEAACSQEERG